MKFKSILRIIIGIVVLVIFIGTIYYLYAKSQKKPVTFQTESPFVTNIIKKTVATGSVIPRKEIAIKSKVSGIVEKIFVIAGDHIKNGDVIARVKIIPDMVTLNNAESRVNRARLSMENAQKDYDRNFELFKSGVISKTDFQQTELTFNNAKEEFESAQSNLDLIKEGASKRAGATTNTLIRTTITGMVLDVPVKEGNSVIESNTFNEGTTIASVADMGEMIFEGKVDESEVGKLKENMELVLTIGAIEKESFKALLEYIAPKGVSESGAIQFQIRAKVTLDKNTFIRAGYSANADIILQRKDSVLSIKEGLITFSGDSAFVEVETSPQTFVKRQIKTGLSDGINIEVLEGVAKTDKLKGAEVKEEEEKKEGGS
ncbi:MAG: efflux RND transporter periplasmic adaptor subunit [Bacteroidia bacterium]